MIYWYGERGVVNTASAMPNSHGMSTRGYNSACNGQLSLKYRFAKALGKWDGRLERVVEPDPVHQAYRLSGAEGGLTDPQIRPRRLQKREILTGIFIPLGLAGLPIDHFSFVAMTWDRESFFSLPGDQLPRFLDRPGVDGFKAMSSQVGWLGYQHLDSVNGLLDAVTPVLRLMVGSVEPSELDVTAATWPRLASEPVSQMSQGMKQLVNQLEMLAVGMFGREKVQFQTGSISIRFTSRVEAKIVPRERNGAFILLGVRPEWPLQVWAGLEPRGYKVTNQPFRFVRLPESPTEAIRITESVLTSLHEVLSQQDAPPRNDLSAET